MESVFHHVGIYCRDIEESIAFYEDVLGCRLLFESDAQEGDKPLKMAWLKSCLLYTSGFKKQTGLE